MTGLPEITHVIGRAEIDAYADLSGDYNPLHMDEAFAATTRFGNVIAHGPIGLQTVFAAVQAWLGEGVEPAGVHIDVRYRAPVRIGAAVTCRALAVREHAGQVTIDAQCTDGDGTEILQALITVPRRLMPGRATA
jgi:3-hydroxybutyryl-CoA dehydratase